MKNSVRVLSVICALLLFAHIASRQARELELEGAQTASSSFDVDNTASVMNYRYHSSDIGLGTGTVLLKDLDFDFLEEMDIPGMPKTRELDFLNNSIFSVSQCPQGLCFTDEFVLIISYSEEEDCMGELIVMDRGTGEYLVTLGMHESSHLGGIAFDGVNVWVCNSGENSIERISYDFIKWMAYENKGEVIDAREVVDSYDVENRPSCITFYGGRLWIATHNVVFNSQMKAYHYNSSQDQLDALSSYKIPARVQGIAFDESGGVYLSTSYGRDQSSYLYCYSSVIALSSRPAHPKRTVELPPCSEEIDIWEDCLYMIFESAGAKYLEGTDGKGQSLSPIDKLLVLPVAQLN